MAHELGFTLPAFAKINLSLRVLGKRAEDNLHEICTTIQTVSLCDYLTFELSDEISLLCNEKSVPTNETNLIVRAANLLRERFFVSCGVRVYLEKLIPSPGGLGGGSADAAITLLALTHLWRLTPTHQDLLEMAKMLGADVPFFLFGGTAFATGTGTKIESLPDLPKKLLLIVTPNEQVATNEAYQALCAPSLTAIDSMSILTICRSARIGVASSFAEMQNDFESTVFAFKPEIERVKSKLHDCGASFSLMSGSGASVFGIFDNETTRQAALAKLRVAESDWRIFSCETVSRSEYKDALSSKDWNITNNLL